MKTIPTAIALALLAFGLVQAEQKPVETTAADLKERAELLMKEKKSAEAAELLEAALELEPDDTTALGRLGMIYTLFLRKPEKAVPLLERGWALGDIKNLQALAIAYISAKDADGIQEHKNDFIANFEDLSGSRIIGFYIAAEDRDPELFKSLLNKVTMDDLNKDVTLSKMVARAAKVLADDE